MNKKLSNRQLSRFYKDIGIFINNGLTIDRCLSVIKQGKKGSLYWMLDNLQYHIQQGGTLSDGLAALNDSFDEFQVFSIRAGEISGRLANTCHSLSRYYEMLNREKKRLIAGLAYPIFLLHAVILLPPLKYLILPNLERSYWEVVLPPLLIAYGVIGLMLYIWKTLLKKGKVREVIDQFLLSLPRIGTLLKGISVVRVLRAFTGLHNAGIEPLRTARMALQTSGNALISSRLNSSLYILENGGTFTQYFRFSGVIPDIQLGIIAVGEETGTLVESLERNILQLEEENHQHMVSLIKTATIVVYFIAALIVAITVISFYTQYFTF